MHKVVLDTNILLVSVSSYSPFHWVFQGLIKSKYKLCVTADILYEYEEIIEKEMGVNVAEYVMSTIENMPDFELITSFFRWNLIEADYDDNKFWTVLLQVILIIWFPTTSILRFLKQLIFLK